MVCYFFLLVTYNDTTAGAFSATFSGISNKLPSLAAF
jgi:hypothetical protein